MSKHLIRVSPILLVIPFLIVFFLFQLLPFFWVFKHSFFDDFEQTWGLTNYYNIFQSKLDIKSILSSLSLSFWSTLLGLTIALWGSYSLTQIKQGQLQHILLSFTNMSSNFSGVPLAFAFLILLGANGCITLILRQLDIGVMNIKSTSGLILIYTYFQIPLGILLLYPAFQSLKREWKESADLLGASVYAYWRYIGLPILIRPIIGTCIILFANAIGAYATLYALSGSNYLVIPIRISALITGDVFYDPYTASALAMLLMVILVTITIINQFLISPKKIGEKS